MSTSHASTGLRDFTPRNLQFNSGQMNDKCCKIKITSFSFPDIPLHSCRCVAERVGLSCIGVAVRSGNIEWLRELRHDHTPEVNGMQYKRWKRLSTDDIPMADMIEAARCGFIDCVAYATSRGYPWDYRVCGSQWKLTLPARHIAKMPCMFARVP